MSDHNNVLITSFSTTVSNPLSGGMNNSNTVIWSRYIQPYVKNNQIFICPSANPSESRYGDAWDDEPQNNIYGRGWISYGLNMGIAGHWFWVSGGTPIGRMIPNTSVIKEPAKMVLIAESWPGPTERGPTGATHECRGFIVDNICARGCSDSDPNAPGGWQQNCVAEPTNSERTYRSLGARHPKYEGLNIGFVDGHSKWFNLKQVMPNKRPADLPPPCTNDQHLIRDANAAGLRWVLFNDCF